MLEVVEVELVPGLVVREKWRLERLVGKGGFGVVWAAVDITTGEPRALKCLTQEGAADAKRQERLRREARAMSGITHPNIAHVFGLEELPAGTPFIVMELLQGRTLHAQLHRGPLSVPQARGILIQIADALRTSHAKGIIHRDLKPANVIIVDDRIAKVLDFGIAKDLSASDRHKLTTTGTTLGTLYYMAPEQIFGERNLDPRADVWALGVLAHECLTLRRPMDAEGDNSGQVLKKILDGNFPRLSTMVRDCPKDIDDLVARMLVRDVTRRPTSEEIYATLSQSANAATNPRSYAKTSPLDGTLPLSDAPLFAQTLHDERFAASVFVPSTVVPSTNVPSTVVPSTNVPATVVPSTNVPSTVVPSTVVPSTVVPSTVVPSTVGAAPHHFPHAATQASPRGAPHPSAHVATSSSQEHAARDSARYAPAITPVHPRAADEPTFDIRAHARPSRSPAIAIAIAIAVFGGFAAIGIAIYVVGAHRAKRDDTTAHESTAASAPPAVTMSAAASAVPSAVPAASASASASASAIASASEMPAAGAGAHAAATTPRRVAPSGAPAGRTSVRPAATKDDPPISNERF